MAFFSNSGGWDWRCETEIHSRRKKALSSMGSDASATSKSARDFLRERSANLHSFAAFASLPAVTRTLKEPFDGKARGSSFPGLGCFPNGSVTDVARVFPGYRAARGVFPTAQTGVGEYQELELITPSAAEMSDWRRVDGKAEYSLERGVLPYAGELWEGGPSRTRYRRRLRRFGSSW